MKEDKEAPEPDVDIPEPEVRARAATKAEVPAQAITFGKAARKAGFEVVARYSRGPRMDQYWRVVEVSGCTVVSARHEDGRYVVCVWVEKTGVRGKNAGVVGWKFDFAYIKNVGRCTIAPATAYCKDPVSTT